VLTDTKTAVAVGWGLAAAFGGFARSLALLRTVTREPRVVAAAGVAAVTAALCAMLNAVNQMLTEPILSDAAGVITGAALAAVAALVWAALGDRSVVSKPPSTVAVRGHEQDPDRDVLG
jgi:sugar (pentulose or hexulose) kinase